MADNPEQNYTAGTTLSQKSKKRFSVFSSESSSKKLETMEKELAIDVRTQFTQIRKEVEDAQKTMQVEKSKFPGKSKEKFDEGAMTRYFIITALKSKNIDETEFASKLTKYSSNEQIEQIKTLLEWSKTEGFFQRALNNIDAKNYLNQFNDYIQTKDAVEKQMAGFTQSKVKAEEVKANIDNLGNSFNEKQQKFLLDPLLKDIGQVIEHYKHKLEKRQNWLDSFTQTNVSTRSDRITTYVLNEQSKRDQIKNGSLEEEYTKGLPKTVSLNEKKSVIELNLDGKEINE